MPLFQIAVLDVQSSSVAFITDSIPNSPVISVLCKAFVYESAKNTNESAPKIPDNCRGEPIFVLTKDASIYVIDGNNGSMISSRPVQLKKSTAISMYVIGKYSLLMVINFLFLWLYALLTGFLYFRKPGSSL